MDYYKHPTAGVSGKAKVGKGTKIWHYTQVREEVRIGKNCILGKGVYVGIGVKIGDNVKVQNRASIYKGTIIEDGAFIGPHTCFLNDKFPRAINEDGSLKLEQDWELKGVKVGKGASIGAGSIILPGIKIGEYAMIGAGSVVTKDLPSYSLCFGNHAVIKGYVSEIENK